MVFHIVWFHITDVPYFIYFEIFNVQRFWLSAYVVLNRDGSKCNRQDMIRLRMDRSFWVLGCDENLGMK